jgi:hypothetical protein
MDQMRSFLFSGGGLVADFSDKSKFNVRSVPEIFKVVSGRVAAYRMRGFGLPGRVFSREVFLNSLLLGFEALPPARQDELLRDGMDRLQALLLVDGEGAIGASSAVDVVVEDVTPGRPARRRGGSA